MSPMADREQKLVKAKDLEQSESFKWLQKDMEIILKAKSAHINSRVDFNGQFQFDQGVVTGINFVLNYPKAVVKDQTRFFEKIMNKINGVISK